MPFFISCTIFSGLYWFTHTNSSIFRVDSSAICHRVLSILWSVVIEVFNLCLTKARAIWPERRQPKNLSAGAKKMSVIDRQPQQELPVSVH